jgi:hypothetical protein
VWDRDAVTRPSAEQRQRDSAGRSPAGRGGGPRRGAGARWRAFAGRYGWRAYALPLLTVVSALVIFNIGSHRDQPPARAAASVGTLASTVASTSAAPSSAATATSSATASSKSASSSRPVVSSPATSLASPALPPGAPYTFQGTGSFSTVAGHSGVLGKGQLYRFTIDVENGITGVDRKVFAATVMAALSDKRSWIGSGAVALQRVDSGPVDFRISLSAPTTVRRICGYSLRIETSCNAGSVGRVVLNVSRWTRGAVVFDGDLANYRRYAVNHEVGHALGHNHSHYCLDNGLAPVMMQQSIGTRTAGGRVCRVNPWPFPPGTADAPGAEQFGDQADADFFQRNSS